MVYEVRPVRVFFMYRARGRPDDLAAGLNVAVSFAVRIEAVMYVTRLRDVFAQYTLTRPRGVRLGNFNLPHFMFNQESQLQHQQHPQCPPSSTNKQTSS